jgi:hypothetical protein
MKHWNYFKEITETLLENFENIEDSIFVPESDDRYLTLVHERLIQRSTDFFNHIYDGDIDKYIYPAKNEISKYLIDINTRSTITLKVNDHFKDVVKRLNEIDVKWELCHIKHEGKFSHVYRPNIQPIYDFYDWFLVEAGLYKWEGKRFVKIDENTSIKEEKNYKPKRIRKQVSRISVNNIDEVYRQNYNQFLYSNSDNVEINGEVVNDRMKRILMLFPREDGKPNIKTATADGLKDGFPLTELDFIDSERQYIILTGKEDITLKKQIILYLEHISTREQDLNSIDTNPPDYPREIFVSQEAFRLFQYLSKEYAYSRKVVEYSQIFHWMIDNEYIRKHTGTKYRKFIVAEKMVDAKFARIEELKRQERTPLNELKKQFENK